mmetsp:Transcript_6010/g.17205  ORF Transcript_6010/g.17205 Transcript_6010/m.17205 type:complete len:122 (+) Transcript_6010:1271-1636(+)
MPSDLRSDPVGIAHASDGPFLHTVLRSMQMQDRSDAPLAGYTLLLFESAPDPQYLASESVVKHRVARTTNPHTITKTACSIYLRSLTLPLEWGSAYQHTAVMMRDRATAFQQTFSVRQRQR